MLTDSGKGLRTGIWQVCLDCPTEDLSEETLPWGNRGKRTQSAHSRESVRPSLRTRHRVSFRPLTGRSGGAPRPQRKGCHPGPCSTWSVLPGRALMTTPLHTRPRLLRARRRPSPPSKLPAAGPVPGSPSCLPLLPSFFRRKDGDPGAHGSLPQVRGVRWGTGNLGAARPRCLSQRV